MRTDEIVSLLVVAVVLILLVTMISSAVGPSFFDTFFDLIGAFISILRMPIVLALALVAVIVIFSRVRFF